MAVALYARVSTTKQADKDLSIPDQLKQMRDWCKARGYLVGAEYVEPGASATDDRRPIFQQMISEATRNPAPFEAIIVHSLSRFFRDALEFALYERNLNRSGVKFESMTQQTSDDPAGGMARKIFNIFDEYQSKENGKHTLRAMQENARQGFSNGSRPTFGYRTVETDAIGNKGRKKRFEVDPVEAEVVRRIFDLYLNGLNGADVGTKRIAVHLNGRGLKMRRQPWNASRVQEVLKNPTYIGQFVFNKRGKDGKRKPETEWITVAVPAIIEKGTFERALARVAARAPTKVPPRMVTNPTLLTGLLKCGACNAGMTLTTGKSGRYRYYKCQTRIGRGIQACDSQSIPMEKLDRLVLEALAEKVFAPSRVKALMAKLTKAMKSAHGEADASIGKLSKELKDLETATERLYEAVEKGI
ncbi:MAG: recombinase family protein, partial [Planctomycetota bacterium]|nr:recombinase family protein [Planctomycetota bacterium]